MGILNMGPAAAIGLIGYFRGLNKAFSGTATLRSDGPASDPHPADVMRGYLAAEVVKLLAFNGRDGWSKVIEAETDKDAGAIVLAGRAVSIDDAKRSARVVAEVLATQGFDALEGHALSEVQNWSDQDQGLMESLIPVLSTSGALPDVPSDAFYGAHVVSAAVMASLQRGANVRLLMGRMIAGLKQLHDGNPGWGPLFGVSRGDLRRDMSYVPARRVVQELRAQLDTPYAIRHGGTPVTSDM
jgi:hypothetical protein